MIVPRVEIIMSIKTIVNFLHFFKNIFSTIPIGAIGYTCPIGRVPTYILPAIEIRFLGRFHPDSIKSERLVCVETNRRTWLNRLV